MAAMAIQNLSLISNHTSLFHLINTHLNPSSISSLTIFSPLPTKITLSSSPNRRAFISYSNQNRESVLDYTEKSDKKDQELQTSMTIGSAVLLSRRRLVVKGRTILTDVSETVNISSGSDLGHTDGAFIGAVFEKESNHQVVSLGRLYDVRFMACFRFKLWWMAQKMGG